MYIEKDQVRPLLSIVVPTKDRAIYAKHCIKSLLEIPSSEVEIVVVDNGESDELAIWIDGIVDIRLVYYRIKGWVSVIDNFETGLKISSGIYVCTIGDDDGVNPEIIEATRWAKNENLDALIPSLSADYSWPDLRMKYYGAFRAGLLRMNSISKRPFKPDLNKELIRCARSGGQSFGSMPKVYYGIIRKDCIEEIYNEAGKFFLGVSPDMCAAVALACTVEKVVCVDYPIFIPGSSAKSTAGSSGLKQHHGSLSDQTHLPLNCEIGWPKEVPVFFAVQTVWAQSAVATLKALKKYNYLSQFNIARLHALCIVFNSHYIKKSINNYFEFQESKEISVFKSAIVLICAITIVLWKRGFGLISRIIFKTKEFDYQYSGLTDIGMATKELGKQLSIKGISWNKYITN